MSSSKAPFVSEGGTTLSTDYLAHEPDFFTQKPSLDHSHFGGHHRLNFSFATSNSDIAETPDEANIRLKPSARPSKCPRLDRTIAKHRDRLSLSSKLALQRHLSLLSEQYSKNQPATPSESETSETDRFVIDIATVERAPPRPRKPCGERRWTLVVRKLLQRRRTERIERFRRAHCVQHQAVQASMKWGVQKKTRSNELPCRDFNKIKAPPCRRFSCVVKPPRRFYTEVLDASDILMHARQR